MDINRLTERAQEALRAAQSEATRQGNQQIDVEHLLLALLDQEGGLAKVGPLNGIHSGWSRARQEYSPLVMCVTVRSSGSPQELGKVRLPFS